ncbi:MAG: PAS domain S-box protein [Verrucomicrobiota bacterium]
MRKDYRHLATGLGVAVASVGAALLVNWFSQPLREDFFFTLFLGAVLVSAWYGGKMPGLVSAGLAAWSSSFYFPTPSQALAIGVNDLLRLCIFILAALLTSSFNEARKRTQEALTASEARKKAILESALDSIVIMDSHGTILQFNPAAEKTFGYSRSDAIGKTVMDLLLKPSEREGFRNGLQNYVATGETSIIGRRIETTAIRANGTEFPAEIVLGKIVAEGPPIFTCSIRDITDRVQAEAAVHRLESLVDSSEDAILSMALDGTIRSWNRGAEKVYGYTAKEIIGRHHSLLLPAECEFELTESLAKITRGERIEHYETVRVRKDGRQIDVSLAVSPIKDAANRITGISSIAYETTARKRAERYQAAQHSVVEVLAESATLDDATPRILQAIGEGIGWDVGVLWTLDRANNVLRAVELWHAPGANIPEFETIVRGSTFAPGIGPAGQVWASGKPTWIADILQDDNFPLAQFAAKAGLRSALAFPIMFSSEVPGVSEVAEVVEFLNRRVEEPEGDLLFLLDALGKQIGQFMERKWTEEQLQRSNQRIVHVVESISDIFLSIDHEWRVTYLNASAAEFLRKLQKSRQEVQSQIIWTVLPDLAGSVFFEECHRAIYAQVAVAFEFFYTSLNAWLGIRAYPSTKGLTLYIRDITEPKRAEEALRQSEDRFRSVFENSPIGISIARNTVFHYINTAHVRLFGYSDASELCGTSLLNLIAPDCREEIGERIRRRERGEPSPDAYETVGCRKDGSLFTFYVEAAKIELPDGPASVAFLIDVTERKRAESERERLIRELQEALGKIKTLSGLLPICSFCKKIRDDKGCWHQVDSYIKRHSLANFTHGFCPDCTKKHFSDYLPRDKSP